MTTCYSNTPCPVVELLRNIGALPVPVDLRTRLRAAVRAGDDDATLRVLEELHAALEGAAAR